MSKIFAVLLMGSLSILGFNFFKMNKKVFWSPWFQLFILIFFVPAALVFLSPRFSIPVKIIVDIILLFLSTFLIKRTILDEEEIIFEYPINPLRKTIRVKYIDILSIKIKKYNYVTNYPDNIFLKTASKKHEIALQHRVDSIIIVNFIKQKNPDVRLEE